MLILFVVPGSVSTVWNDGSNWKQTLVAFLAWAVAAMPSSILPKVRRGTMVALRGVWTAGQIFAPLALIWFGIGAVNHATDDMDRLYIATRMCEERVDAMNLDVCRLILAHDSENHILREAWIAAENERIRMNTLSHLHERQSLNLMDM